jgi:hypothetical protein
MNRHIVQKIYDYPQSDLSTYDYQIGITPSFRAEIRKQMTDWALALKMVRFLIFGAVRTKALKTHLLFSALRSGVNRTGLGRFADNHKKIRRSPFQYGR